MADVFVSYATEDRERVKPIVEAIERAGFSVWWDRRIELGSSFDREIEHELDAAACVVVFWSTRSVGSDWVRNEAQEGLDRGVLVPLSLDDEKPPLAFRRAQTAHLSSTPTNEELQTVLTAVTGCLGRTASSNSSGSLIKQKDPAKLHKATLAIAVLIVVCFVGWWFISNKVEESSSHPAISSLTILPLSGIGLGPDSQWLTLGIPSELSSMLSKISLVSVASQSNAFALHKSGSSPTSIGEALDVQGVLVGTLQATEDELQLKMELIRVADGNVVWRENFEAPLDEPRRLQTRLAGQIFKRFGTQYSSYTFNRPKTEEAYRAHLHRVALELSGNIGEELKWAELTIALEPDFAMGYVNVVWPYLYQAMHDPIGPWQEKVRAALDRAAQLGIADSAEYKTHEAQYQWYFNGNLEDAEVMLRDAYLEGDYFGVTGYIRMLAASGLHDSVLPLLERLVAIEPYKPLPWDLLAVQKAYRGDFLGAAEATTKVLQLTPDSFFNLESRAIMYGMAGEFSRAQQDLDLLRTITEYPEFRRVSTEAAVAHWRGDSSASRTVGEGFANNNLHLYAGMHFLLAGDPRAEEELRLAAKAPGWVKYLLDSYEWRLPAELRESDAWKNYRASLGFTDSWRLEICRTVASMADGRLECDLVTYD